jgi:hypothetical protein
MNDENYFTKAFRKDPVSSLSLTVVVLVLVAELAMCLCVRSTSTGRATNLSLFVLACSVGSLLGMLSSPYTNAEKQGFSSTAKILVAFVAGLLTETIKTRLTETCLSGRHMFLAAVCLSAATLTFGFSYVLRSYIVPNLYEGPDELGKAHRDRDAPCGAPLPHH